MSVCSDGNDNLFVSDLNRVTKVVYANYMYHAQTIAGKGGSVGKFGVLVSFAFAQFLQLFSGLMILVT